jgi:hypothetical protein
MHRMGHGSMRAALIYQHATDARAREIAAALNEVVARETKPDDDDGAAGVLVPAGYRWLIARGLIWPRRERRPPASESLWLGGLLLFERVTRIELA